MSTKHFFPNQNGLVVRALKGVASQNPSLGVLESDKVLFHLDHDSSKVSLLSGGGSGHEPAHSGYVGKGMLAAAVCGDVFASPNTKQIMNACKVVGSDDGYIFIVTNYTGDMLHFGLACEKIKSHGTKVALIKSADDVSVGRTMGGSVGRRGLSGTIVINKVLGGAAEAGSSFEVVEELGHAIASNIVTIGAGLDHCHVPGNSEEFGGLGPEECEIGLGIHNEPGVTRLDEIPPIESLVKSLLGYLLDQSDSDRSFVKIESTDKVALMINNLGGLSIIEQNAIVEVVLDKLSSEYGIVPIRVFAGHFMTSLNAPSFSITLLNITQSVTKGTSESKIIEYLDAPTDAVNWPSNHYKTSRPIDLKSQVKSLPKSDDNVEKRTLDLLVDPSVLESKLRTASNNLISAEPDLTKWDTKMGDGDCGKTLESGAMALLRSLDSGLASPGSIIDVLERIVDITEENMGGTLGAIFGIYFASFSSSLKHIVSTNPNSDALKILAQSANEALDNLRLHTAAKEGDRTVMDVLIPFCKALVSNYDLKEALEEAHQAAEKTKTLVPKLGRATYVGGVSEMTVFPPDPGAWALYEILKGIL
ncbi:Dak1p [Sugiyamaella lignohabitans]|uniref:Dak1p n=1 Tax=Sugiyamaella lignohabitans TaxID=796027 RepID=A0A167F1I1_9ASCO|nr:Dak1p [Sugiyamaella lignohabitans]ANB14705.1 Dak1p [Sugiyamaella lignohabitans]